MNFAQSQIPALVSCNQNTVATRRVAKGEATGHSHPQLQSFQINNKTFEA